MSRAGAVSQQAIALFEAGQHAQAKETLRRYLQRAPADAQANKTLAMIHGALHEDDQAFIFITRAANAAPDDPEIQFMLGNVATMVRKYKDGARAYTAVLRVVPQHLDAYDGLAKCQLSLGDYPAAMQSYERAIAVNPDEPNTYFRMGVALALIGRVDEALTVARRGLARRPGDVSLLEFLVYYQNFVDGVDPVAHREEHAVLGREFMRMVAAHGAPRFPNTPDPERPLRVGIMSADLYFHACAFFLESPLRSIDQSRCQIFIYSLGSREDEHTRRFKTLGQWRDCREMPPEQIASVVRADGIDVLIECSGWTERPVMFACAQRLAPVQATYLGYPNTTGLPTIDYRLIDALTDPPGSEDQCTESLVRLPGCFLCYRPPEGTPTPDSWEPPCAAPNAPITFGSFNRPMKIGPAAIDAWGKILSAVPDSRLLIKLQIASEEVGRNFIGQLERRGVVPSRVITADWKKNPGEHFPMYRRMDIALDSFPYNGTTTTCEAMWMGVPAVALAGSTHRARVGVSLLSAVGVPELAAPDPEAYVKIAVDLARDRARIAAYHRTLRQRMAGSVLVDGPSFARGLEAAIRGMWRAWCAAPAQQSRP